MEPAKPYFDIVDIEHRIQSTDGQFVDVIHTNSGNLWDGGLSFPEPLGQVDFYPNGGDHQPGCAQICVGSACLDIDLIDLFGGEKCCV